MRLAVNIQKSMFCRYLIVVDRVGTRPSSKKNDAVMHLSRSMMVEDVMTLLGMSGYLRKFVPSYSMLVAPMSDLLSDPLFSSKGTRGQKVP